MPKRWRFTRCRRAFFACCRTSRWRGKSFCPRLEHMFLPTRLRPHPEALRFVPFFIGINLIGGVSLVFFSAWLTSIGFSATAVATLMAAMNLLRVISGPALGVAADAFAARRLAIICLMSLAAASYAGYAAFTGVALVVLF